MNGLAKIDKQKVRPMVRYACAQLPECAWLWEKDDMRNDLIKKNKLKEFNLRDEAKKVVALHVLGRVPYNGDSAEFIRTLIRKGYSREEVAQALGEAWLSDSDYFELPKRNRLAWINTLFARLVFSLVITVFLVIIGMKYFIKVNPVIDQYLMTIPPLLSFVALPILSIVFIGLSWLLDIFNPKKSSNSP